jgi:hypothetical protein
VPDARDNYFTASRYRLTHEARSAACDMFVETRLHVVTACRTNVVLSVLVRRIKVQEIALNRRLVAGRPSYSAHGAPFPAQRAIILVTF